MWQAGRQRPRPGNRKRQGRRAHAGKSDTVQAVVGVVGMDKQNPSKKPEEEKINIDLEKEFLMAQMELYSAQSKELLRSAVSYSQQAIRGMFLLHGACATAIVATGEVWKYKEILYILGIGALLATVTSGLSYVTQSIYNNSYYKIASDTIFDFYSLNLKKLRQRHKNITASDCDNQKGPDLAKCFLYASVITWILSASCFFKVLCVFSNL